MNILVYPNGIDIVTVTSKNIELNFEMEDAVSLLVSADRGPDEVVKYVVVTSDVSLQVIT